MSIVFAKPPRRNRPKAAAQGRIDNPIVTASDPKKVAAAKRYEQLREAMKQPPDPEVQAFMARMIRPPE